MTIEALKQSETEALKQSETEALKQSEAFSQEAIYNVLNNNFNIVAPEWWKHQLALLHDVYDIYKDYDKFFIVIYLLKKTFDSYSNNFQYFTMDQFYSKDRIEIEKFNIIEISKTLSIPKETVRRKLMELEDMGNVIRYKKKTIMDRSAFPGIKPINSLKRISIFLSRISIILKKHKVLNKSFNSIDYHRCISENFTYCWKLFYELQIPINIEWKKYFKELEIWVVYGICVMNKEYSNPHNETAGVSISDYTAFLAKNRSTGLNAMTISDITGIPRATVVRKLKRLVKEKHLLVDKHKRYHPAQILNDKEIIVKKIIKYLSIYIYQINKLILFK
jgi:DNA-binding MarR family transcriptional regulator